MIKTEYKCIISLNFTTKADNNNPTPSENTTMNPNGITAKTTFQCNSALVAIITTSNAVNDANKLIKLENTLEITNKYLGIYTFLINAALLITADIALVVASEKKLKIICPLNKYKGKFSTLNLKIFEKTKDNTIIIQSGFSKVQRTPSTDLLYFILISLETNSLKSGWNFIKFCIYVDTSNLPNCQSTSLIL